MATLYERLTGYNNDDDKMAIQLLRAVIREYKRGNITGANAVNILNLTNPQKTDAQRLLTAINNTANKNRLFEEMWDLLLLAEVGAPAYQNEAAFWARIEAI